MISCHWSKSTFLFVRISLKSATKLTMFSQMNSFLDVDERNLDVLLDSVVSVCDLEYSAKPVPRAQGSFISLHFLSLFLKHGHPCCVLSFSEMYTHAKVIMTKCGFPIQTHVNSGLLRFVSAHDSDFDELATQGKTDSLRGNETSRNIPVAQVADATHADFLKCIFQGISRVTAELRAKNPDRAPCIIVEDLSLLSDLGLELGAVIAFIHSLRSAVENGCLVLYSSASEDLDTDAGLRNFLAHYADHSLDAYGLKSGLSSALDGQLRIRMRSPNSLQEKSKILQYKIQERRVQFFAPGTSTGTL